MNEQGSYMDLFVACNRLHSAAFNGTFISYCLAAGLLSCFTTGMPTACHRCHADDAACNLARIGHGLLRKYVYINI